MNHSAELVMEKHHDALGARVGMWLFLFTELLLFGGLFLLYSVYLNRHPQEFHFAATELDQFMGAMNTVILLTSSFTIAVAIAALQRNNRKLAIFLLVVTMLLAMAFLVNKYFEWGAKISHGIYPSSPDMANHPHGEILFFSLYYVMTGLHGLHVLVGIVIMGFMLRFIVNNRTQKVNLDLRKIGHLMDRKLELRDDSGKTLWESEKIGGEVKGLGVLLKGPVDKEAHLSNVIKLENTGLYWHLVDIIWIFLFPLFYLIAR